MDATTTPLAAEAGPPPAAAGPSGAPEGAAAAFRLLVASFVLVLGAVTLITTRAQDGVFTYAIDDPMIHLSLARNLVQHGTFGLVPGVYESASSAPLWELLLAPILAVAPGAWWAPLLLNVAAAIWLLHTLSRIPFVGRLARGPVVGAVALLALPVGLGLVPLVLTGMEHTLQVAIVARLLVMLVDRLRGPTTRRGAAAWYVLFALGSLLRFETLFVALGFAVALVALPTGPARRDRHLGVALATLAATFAPVVGFAVVNRSFGQYAFPNSVEAKTALGRGIPLPTVDELWTRASADLLLVLITAAAGVVLWRVLRRSRAGSPAGAPGGRGPDVVAAPLIAMLVTVAAHLVFADVGWFERYQAYLVVGLVVAIALALPATKWVVGRDRLRNASIVIVAISVLRLVLLVNTPIATFNVYENQYQLGRFLAGAYPGEAVAVNDIGYVSWEHEGDLVDLAGLGSFDLLDARKRGELNSTVVGDDLRAHDVRVLAVYDEFFANLVPDGWEPGGRWCVQTRRMVLSSDCVTFYAPAGADLAHLQQALADYAPNLPSEVVSTPA